MDDRDLVEDSADEYKDLPASSNKRGISRLIGGLVGNGIACAVLFTLSQIALPFIGPLYVTVLPWLFLERGVDALVPFLRLGYDSPVAQNLGKLLKSAAGAVSSFFLWKHYPFIFANLDLAILDRVLPYVFMAFTLLGGLGTLKSFFKLFKPETKKNKHHHKNLPPTRDPENEDLIE